MMKMGNIEKYCTIDENNLDEEFYFQSLVKEAYRLNLLADSDIESIQYGCLELLAFKTNKYNSGDSSSIRVEVAEDIMISNHYVIGIWLKSFSCTDEAIKELKTTKVFDLYNRGKKRIAAKINTAKHIFMLTLKNKIDTDNYTYNSTVVDGIKGFFKLYNSDFEAHEIHITADYPLCNQIRNLVGIEFIEKYLQSIYYENMFCKCFSSDDIQCLLFGYEEDYRDLIFNIFRQVLATAIGCELIHADVTRLNITNSQLEHLHSMLISKSNEEIKGLIFDASKNLYFDLNLTNIPLQKYIENCLDGIINDICYSVKENTLNKIFIVKKYPECDLLIQFSFGEKMNNESYRKTIEEIINCRYLSDKVSIIQDKIHSLSDMEDLLIDAELKENEIMAVLSNLNLFEIAALSKHHPYKSEIEAIEYSESEIKLQLCLHNYILLQNPKNQEQILKAIKQMNTIC